MRSDILNSIYPLAVDNPLKDSTPSSFYQLNSRYYTENGKCLMILDENISCDLVRRLRNLAYLHEVVSVNDPHNTYGLHKGLPDHELIPIAEMYGNAPIITKDKYLNYARAIVLPNGNCKKEADRFIKRSAKFIIQRLYDQGFTEYETVLPILY